MTNKTSKEYAVAAFSLAKDRGSEKSISDSLLRVSKELRENPEYVDLLSSPGIPVEERLACLDKAFSGIIDDDCLSLLKILCENGKMRYFDEIAKEYSALYQIYTKTAFATVISARELTADEKERLKAALCCRMKKEVEIEYRVDKDLIGGIMVIVDGCVIDGTVKTKLTRIKEVIDK